MIYSVRPTEAVYSLQSVGGDTVGVWSAFLAAWRASREEYQGVPSRTVHGKGRMTLWREQDLTDLRVLSLHASEAEVVPWNGRRALRLVDGLALLPDLRLDDVSIEVWIGVEGPAYPGVAFRVTDVSNYELVYPVPHVSGLWDALQYDPVFHGSNTWQLYHGLSYQAEATVPLNEWFRLRVDVKGNRAAFTVGEQPPLVVGRLAHGKRAGLAGLWTFKPAYFAGLKISECRGLPESRWRAPKAPQGLIEEWFLEGFGVVRCESGGILNVNRYLPVSMEEAVLTRQFESVSEGQVEVGLGFSDQLSLELDGEVIFEGSNTFAGFADYGARGYAYAGMVTVPRTVTGGIHRLSARLRVTELFGWGLILALKGENVRLLPATLG
jgi:hypothetical protein